MAIVFTVEPQEAEAILQIIGNLPTHTNAFPLFTKLKEQAMAQVAEQTPAEE